MKTTNSNSRRWVRIPLAIAALASLLLACTGGEVAGEQESDVPGETAGNSTVSADGQESSGEPQHGGTLVYVIVADPPTLNPAITTGAPELLTACKIFEGLVRLDKNLEPQPSLAADWDISEDGLQYTFHLQEGVTWHDGEPFTSSDVKWTFENVTREYGARAAEPFESVESITTPDDHTVELTMSEPYGPLLSLLTCANAAILPEHVYSDGDILSHPRNDDPIGTGPFTFGEWVHGDRITLNAYEDYWRQDRPYLDSIVMRIITDPAAAVAGLESGEVDVLGDYVVDKADFVRLQETEGLAAVQDTNVPTNNLLMFNVRQEPFDNPDVRKAVAHAIDRNAIVERAMFGLGNPGKSAIDSRLGWAHNPDVDYQELYSHDPARAEELLDEAGYTADGDGQRLSVTLPYETGNPDFDATSQIIRDNLEAVGIEVILEPMERSVMFEEVFANHEFDMYLTRYTTSGDVALGVQRIYISSSIGEDPFNNASGYSNPDVDALFAEGATLPTTDQRQEPYHAVQELIAEDIPTLVLTENPSVGLAAEEVRGLWQGQDEYDFWEQVWIEQ